MTFKMTVRGAPPAVRYRTYQCDDCGYRIECRVVTGDEAAPDCPKCETITRKEITSPHIQNGALVKAVGIAEDMMRNDYGMTNMRDNLRPGDVAAMAPAPMQTAERNVIQQQVAELAGPAAAASLDPGIEKAVKNFWQGTAGQMRAEMPTEGSTAARGQTEAVAAKADALSVLDSAKTWGNLHHRVEASSDMKL